MTRVEVPIYPILFIPRRNQYTVGNTDYFKISIEKIDKNGRKSVITYRDITPTEKINGTRLL